MEGKEKVESIVFAIDAGLTIFKEAITFQAYMIIIHYGHFLKESISSN